MQKIIHRENDRGHVDFGWLKSAHSFSFGQYFDPEKVNFGALRVLNDDEVEGGQGFGRHGHANMEIVSIPLSGVLSHEDSMGNGRAIETGDVQIMSAGTGVEHAEFNGDQKDPVKFLQIWVIPNETGLKPRYDQKSYLHLDRHNKFATIVSPDTADRDAVHIHQDAYFNLTDLDEGKTIKYTVHSENNGMYLFVLEGKISVDQEILGRRDAIGIYGTDNITIEALYPTKLLLIEVPMF
ncbi:pirin family protein [Sphingobacterium sp. N143]|uniref:pirin family protein n=1 Tax=Sphingobacterium sp. N143 TaxID=2746727 RepID=UPI002576A1D1|nr:pirin family protein [Sphingobacterium sp. N143]MDM1296004.1 pirin family protein [Sphingobacterium sp. N143]